MELGDPRVRLSCVEVKLVPLQRTRAGATNEIDIADEAVYAALPVP